MDTIADITTPAAPSRDMSRARYPSPDEARRYRRDLEGALEAVRKKGSPGAEALAWPAGLDRTLVLALPLSVTTRSCLRRAGLMEGDNALTWHELLRNPDIGSRAIRELLFGIDAFLRDYIERFDARPEPAAVLAMRLQKEVNRLTPRECAIVEHRVLRRPPTTLAVVGAMFGVSRERIRHLQARAGRRMLMAAQKRRKMANTRYGG